MREVLHNYTEGEIIEVNENKYKIKKIVKRRNNTIIARIKSKGAIILWEENEYENHKNDTEEQFIKRIKEVLSL